MVEFWNNGIMAGPGATCLHEELAIAMLLDTKVLFFRIYYHGLGQGFWEKGKLGYCKIPIYGN